MIYSYGTDQSKWQDDNTTIQQIDWKKNKDAGCDFAGIRIAFDRHPDEDWEYNWAHAWQEALLRMGYHLPNYKRDPYEQADIISGLLQGDVGEINPVCDMEFYGPWGNIGHNEALDFYEPYMTTVDKNLEVLMMPYTNVNWLLYVLHPIPEWLLKRDLWVAHWHVELPLTGDWKDWRFHQHTNTAHGPTYGAESNAVDMNRFNGDTSALYRRFGIDTPPPPPDAEIGERIANLEGQVEALTNWKNREL